MSIQIGGYHTYGTLLSPQRLSNDSLHESVVRCMAVDGDRIVTGSSDKTVGVCRHLRLSA